MIKQRAIIIIQSNISSLKSSTCTFCGEDFLFRKTHRANTNTRFFASARSFNIPLGSTTIIYLEEEHKFTYDSKQVMVHIANIHPLTVRHFGEDKERSYQDSNALQHRQ